MTEKTSKEIADNIEKAIEELADLLINDVGAKKESNTPKPENKGCKNNANNAIEDLKKRVIALEASSEVDLNYLADMRADIKTIQMGMEDYNKKIDSLEKRFDKLEDKLNEQTNAFDMRLNEVEEDVDELNFNINDIYTEFLLPKVDDEEEEEEDEDVCEEKEEEEEESESEKEEDDVEKTIVGILNLHNFDSKDFINLITKITTDYIDKLKKH